MTGITIIDEGSDENLKRVRLIPNDNTADRVELRWQQTESGTVTFEAYDENGTILGSGTTTISNVNRVTFNLSNTLTYEERPNVVRYSVTVT